MKKRLDQDISNSPKRKVGVRVRTTKPESKGKTNSEWQVSNVEVEGRTAKDESIQR